MAYEPANLSLGFDLLGGKFRVWVYQGADPFSTVDDTDYFSNASAVGMEEGDIVFCSETDQDPPILTIAYVSAIDADGNGTVTAAAFAGAATFTDLTATGNVVLGNHATDTVGFFGAGPAAQQAVLAAITTTQPTATVFGFTTTAQFNNLIAAVNTLIANQKTFGFIATA